MKRTDVQVQKNQEIPEDKMICTHSSGCTIEEIDNDSGEIGKGHPENAVDPGRSEFEAATRGENDQTG